MSRTALAFKSRPEAQAARTRPTLYLEPRKETRSRLKTLDDNAVFAAYSAGCDAAFTELFDRYSGRITSYITRLIGDRERAEDLAQETFIRIYRNAWRFDRTKKFSSWIYAIAGNLAKNELRSRSRGGLVTFNILETAKEEDNRPLQFEDPRSKPDKMMHQRYLHEIVDETVLMLSPDHRSVFVLREMEGKRYNEISEILGVSEGTVKSRLFRARVAFAAIIGPMLD